MLNRSQRTTSLFTRIASNCALPLISVSVIIILIATLYPFTMQWERLSNSGELIGILKNFLRRSSGADDRIHNIFLFMPLGFGLAAFLMPRQLRWWWLLSLFACTALSLVVESLQTFLPSRAPTAIDIVTNTFGGMLGMLAFVVAQRICTTRRRFALAVSLGVGVLFLLIVPLQRAARFSNWDYGYSLSIGNDLTGSEAWAGTIRTVALGTTEITAEQLAQVTSSVQAEVNTPWLVRYDFTVSNPLVDKTQQQEMLVPLKPELPVRIDNGMTIADGQAFVLSPDATTPLIAAMQRQAGMTVLLAVAPNSTIQQGRIVSITADDDEHMNFDIAQDESDLIARVRTPATGEHGTPALIAHEVFGDKEMHTIAISYQRGILRVAVDGAMHPETLEVTPALAFFSLALPFKANIALGRYEWMPIVYEIAYAALLFVPWGLAAALWMPRVQSKLLQTVYALSTGFVAILIYVALVSISGGSWPSLPIASLQVAAAVLAVELFYLMIGIPIQPRLHKQHSETAPQT